MVGIKMNLLSFLFGTFGRSSNGRTRPSGGRYLGSNPSLPAMKKGIFFASVIFLLAVAFSFFPDLFGVITYSRNSGPKEIISKEKKPPVIPPLDTALYDQKLKELSNNPPPPPPETKIMKNPETGEEETVVVEKPAPKYLWPAPPASPDEGGGAGENEYPRAGANL